MSRRTLSGLAIVGVFVLLNALAAHAASLRPGDIVVSEQSSGRVYVIDPVTGSVSWSSSNLLEMPMQVAIDNAGQIYTAEREGGVRPGIVRVDPATNAHTLLQPEFGYPVALDFGLNGHLYVADVRPQALVEIDANTGLSRVIADLTGILANDVEVEADGRILIADPGRPGFPDGRIFRFDPATGTVNLFATGFTDVVDLALTSAGEIYAANSSGLKTVVLHIDRLTGAKTPIVELPQSGTITFETDQALLYANFYGGVYRVALGSHFIETVAPPESFLRNLTGIAVYRPVPEPSTMLLACSALASLALLIRQRRTS